MHLNSTIYQQTPWGVEPPHILSAQAAELETSRELISDQAPDSAYFRGLEKLGLYLNKAQIEAVRHVNGPLLTLAGAGSGKTSVLVSRAGYLILEKGVAPEHILMVTFSKKAADEMGKRMAWIPGMTNHLAQRVQTQTFHAFFLRILRHRGYRQEILHQERYKQIIMKQFLKEMGLQDSYQPEALISLISSYKIKLQTVEHLPERNQQEKEIKQIFARYEHWKARTQKWDFDDILLESYELLKKTPSLLHSLQQRFHYVMVDEFQDCNLLQYELIKFITAPQNNFCVVGDDDQTIYSFNGASHDFILNFPEDFPDAKVVTLQVNYRSTPGILGLGNAVIGFNKKRRVKSLKATKGGDLPPLFLRPPNMEEEADWIGKHIRSQVEEGKRQYKDFVILYRASSQSRAIFEQLISQKLPFISYSLGDQNFYEQWMIKPIMDYLRLSQQPRDFDALDGILHTLYINRDLGMEWLRKREREQPRNHPLLHLLEFPEIKSFQKHQVKERIQWIQTLKEVKPIEAISRIRGEFYDKFLETQQHLSLQKEILKETLDELEASAKRFQSITDFLSFAETIILQQREHERTKENHRANAISIMTIHRSKGLEFPVVFLIGASEGILPHISAIEADKYNDFHIGQAKTEKIPAAIEEERRLTYVAITRAQEELFISSPAFYRGKKTEVSRFILAPYKGSKG